VNELAAVARETASVVGQAAPVATLGAPLRAPYPGLRSFRPDESDLFFGREDFVTTMVDRLAATRFLAVLGSSGTGKSSVVKTGLLDALELGLMGKARSSWRIADFRPGSDPLRNLAGALLTDEPHATAADLDMLRGFLARGPRSIIEWCRDGNLPAGTNLLLLADQFEELFRYQDYARREETQALVELLLESARSTEFSIYVTITMRSEYLGACALIEGLAEAISHGMVLIPRMTRDQCRAAIVGPAKVCGIQTDLPLVNQLLNDLAIFASWDDEGTGDELDKLVRRADQLPLLQYTMNRMWLRARQRRGDGDGDGRPLVLRLADYEAIGGLRGALNEHADQLLKDLADKAPESVVESVFRGLVSGATVAEAVRRPRPFGELVKLAGGNEQAVRDVVDTFRQAGVNFLAPELDSANPKPLDNDTFIDISHESLIRQWGKLSGWLEQEARAAQHWRRLRDRMADGDLLQGRELAALVAWKEEMKPNAEWAKRYGGDFNAAMSFLDSGERAEQQRLEAIRRAEQERRRRRNILAAAVVGTLGVFLGGFSLYAVIENYKLEDALVKQKNALTLADAKTAEAEKAKADAEQAKADAEQAKKDAQAALAKMVAAQEETARIKEEDAKIKEEAREKAQEKTAEAAKDLGPRPTGTYADETKSFGVDPPNEPVKEVNGPTPTVIPGGKVLTTAQLWEAIANKSLGTIVLVDVSSEQHPTTIPSANRLPTAGQGTMDEQARKAFWEALKKLSGNNWDISIVFFGRDAKDWEGYNAALRAIDIGFARVYWYRGGIAAWTAAHQPLK
jgi:hypothetical protein